jgi:hypothetical protein
MNLYRKFIDGLVMKRYNELTRDSNEVLFTPDYEMSGIRGAVNTMAVTLVIFIALPPNPLFAVFVWIFLCALIGKQAKENKMSKGYPYLKFMEMQVLVFGYLIAIPIAIIIYGLFAFAFESLIFAFTQDWIVASVVRILILFITWIFYMFFFRNNEWDDRNKEWIKKFAAQDQEIEEKENEVREKNGTYENFVKNLDEEFTFPYLKEKEEIKDPVISKKKLDNFIKWVNSLSKDNKRLDLASLLNKNKKLEVIVPELSVLFSRIEKGPGAMEVKCLDNQDLSTYRIHDNSEYYDWEFSDNRKWVTIINNPNVTIEVCDDIYEDYAWDVSGEGELYLEEGESKAEEQDLFYWYIHKLKKEL